MSEEIRVELGARSYDVRFGELAELAADPTALPNRPAFGVVDERVAELHAERIARAFGERLPTFVVPGGERSKTPETYLDICRALVRSGVERGDLLVGIGGGVVTDLAGFAAATFHRGIDWVAVPTTVLAMVDASVGGKSGVNLDRAKNLLGAFHQPLAVLVDLAFVDTLDRREVVSGLVEALKIALVRDAELVHAIERAARALVDGERDALERVLARAIRLKSELVAEDERESGARALLNLGHTIGHALEAAALPGRWLHGEAVAIGIACAARLSVRHAGLSGREEARVRRILAALGAPLQDPDTPWTEIERYVALDKKVAGGRPGFVLTPRIGSGTFGVKISQHIVTQEVAGFFGGAG